MPAHHATITVVELAETHVVPDLQVPAPQHNDATHILCDTRSQGTPPKAVLFTLHNVGDSKNLTPDPTERQTRPGNQTTFQALRRHQTSKTTSWPPTQIEINDLELSISRAQARLGSLRQDLPCDA
jgi:hypothetical protein